MVPTTSIKAGFLLTFISIAVAAQAQTQTVDTWIGKLELDVGYPSKATAEKLYDEMDFQRATQAFIWALPAIGFQALHLAHLNSFGAKDGDVVLYADLKDKEGMLTPNITTLYAFSFWNMKEQGPLVVEVPAGATAGGVLDIWQRPLTDTGQTGPEKGQGAKFLILSPGSEESLCIRPRCRCGSQRAASILIQRWRTRPSANTSSMPGRIAPIHPPPNTFQLAAGRGSPNSPTISTIGNISPIFSSRSQSKRATA